MTAMTTSSSTNVKARRASPAAGGWAQLMLFRGFTGVEDGGAPPGGDGPPPQALGPRQRALDGIPDQYLAQR